MITIKVAPVILKFFYIFIVLMAFWPFKYKFYPILGMNISAADILLVMIFLFLIPMYFKKLPTTPSSKTSIKILYFIFVCSFLSMTWATQKVDSRYIVYQLVLMFLTVSIPYLISKIANDKHIDYHKLISNFATLLTAILLIYMVRNLGQDERLDGYLGGAAIISVIIIPALAVHLHNVLNRKRILISFICLFISTVSIFYTESRAGLVMLLLFLFITILRKPTILRLFAIVFISLVFIVSFGDKVSTDRYTSFEDTARDTITETSMLWWKDSTASLFFGTGYGNVWQWAEYQKNKLPGEDQKWFPTEKGPTMVHSHSVFGQSLAELGLVGLIPFLILVFILFKETFKSWIRKYELKTNILIGLICTLPTFYTDLMIFRNWEVSIIWLFFYFSALTYRPYLTNSKVKDNVKQNKMVA